MPAAQPPQPARVLVVDDDELILRSCKWILRQPDLEVALCSDGAQALEAMRRHTYDVVLTDLTMPGIDGHALLKRIKRDWPTVEVVIMTANGSIPSAVEATRDGAHEYVQKPFSVEALQATVRQAARVKRLRDENDALRRQLAAHRGNPGLESRAPAMRAALDRLRAAVPVDATVLLLGEVGSGRGHLARALHDLGPRAGQPFVAIPSAALGTPGNTVDDVFARAAGGTLFLRDVEHATPEAQRALEDRLRAAAAKPRPSVRVVASGPEGLAEPSEAGGLGADLLYLLRAVEIEVPPLRARREDIARLATTMLTHAAERLGRPPPRLAPETLDALAGHGWPDNLTELESAMESALLACDGDEVQPAHLPDVVRPRLRPPASNVLDVELPYKDAMDQVMESHAIQYLGTVLDRCGSIAAAARHAGMDRANFKRLLKRFDVQRD
ncbi:MAG: sigma-54-dependent Fis family transcriptional regulator [Myxococcales bacterium]|nr:sigma-54-dependent Fis family transcriptional regulator [Myxococcales bacterium]